MPLFIFTRFMTENEELALLNSAGEQKRLTAFEPIIVVLTQLPVECPTNAEIFRTNNAARLSSSIIRNQKQRFVLLFTSSYLESWCDMQV